MKFIKKLLPVLVLTLFIYSCDDDNDSVIIDTNSIVDVAIDNNLSSLVTAVTRANLESVLSREGEFTVLAPTNAAFATFLDENDFDSLNDVPVNLLRNILLNHVITGSLQSTQLTTGYVNTNAISVASNTNMSIYINVKNGVVFNGISTVQTANIMADNGIVHVVDKVIGLPNVVTFATADPNFSILVDALTREDDYNYVTTLSTAVGTSPTPFTVFAPTNDAFVALLEELEVNALGDIATETLTSILKTHVVLEANVLEVNLSNNMIINTLGVNLTVSLTANSTTLTDSKDRVSNIITTDVQANNGVIHAISKVVLE
jgi:uncharacterized surface protein with fasciclin (FAS1) repeats